MTVLEAFAAVAEAIPSSAWIAVVLVGAVVLYRSLHPKLLPGIPIGYPQGVQHAPWLVGFGPEFKECLRTTSGMSAFFIRYAPAYGAVWQVPVGPAGTWLGRMTGLGEVFVVCADSQEIEDACSRNAASFSRSVADGELFQVSAPTGMIALPAGPQLRHHRRVLGPSMTGAYLARMVPRIEACVDDLVSLWKARTAQAANHGGKAFDVNFDLLLVATDIISDLAFGKAFGAVNDIRRHLQTVPASAPAESSPAIPRLVECILHLLALTASIALAGPLGPWYTLYYRNVSRPTRAARRDLIEMVEGRMNEERALRRASGHADATSRPHDADHVLGMVLDGEAADLAKGNPPLPDNELCDELLTFVFGGAETTATTFAWTVKFLARKPEVQSRLRAELVDRLPGALSSSQGTGESSLNFAQLNDETLLPYTTATAYECLRLAQAAGQIVRTAMNDTTLLGHRIPAGTRVVFLTSWVQASATEEQVRPQEEQATREGRRAKDSQRKWGYWGEDVAEFRPERWLKSGPDGAVQFDRSAGPWFPFGAGARGCFGKNLAILEFKVFLVKLVGAFFLESVPADLDSDAFLEIISRRPTQCYVRLTPFEASSTTGH